jgi:hypothetical protein
MILTEEQWAAIHAVSGLLTAVGCPQCHSYLQKNYTHHIEVLRAMIDSSEHIREPPKMIGFDLEKNRAAIDSAINSLLCEGWDNEASTVRRLVAEIERLRADYDKLKSSLLVIDGCKKLMNQAARIDELEADNQNLVTLNKSLMNNDWILRDNNRKYRKRAQKAELLNKELKADLEQSERVVEARLDVIDQQAAKIRELEDAHKRSGVKYAKIINELRSSVYANIPGLKKQWDEILNAPANGKIGPDADAKPREGLYGKYCISKADGSPVDPNADYFVLRLDTDPVARRAAREYSYVTPDRDLARGLQDRLAKYDPQLKDCMNIQFFGLEKPHCWQITEERKAALWHAINVLKENDIMEEPEGHLWDEEVTVLQAMLTEAE